MGPKNRIPGHGTPRHGGECLPHPRYGELTRPQCRATIRVRRGRWVYHCSSGARGWAIASAVGWRCYEGYVSWRCTMASCTGAVSFFCCCGDTCNCDQGCCNSCNTQSGCNYDGKSTGACGNAYTNERGFAWPCEGFTCCNNCNPTGDNMGPNCGDTLYFYQNCGAVTGAPRVDFGPLASLCRIADLTKTSFMHLAPLSKGVLQNVTASTSPC